MKKILIGIVALVVVIVVAVVGYGAHLVGKLNSPEFQEQVRRAKADVALADESFEVVVVHDACAAATDELHRQELEIINMIYCHVVSLDDLDTFLT